MKIYTIMEKYLMERFSTTGKMPTGGSKSQKIMNIAEHAATVAIDWMNIKKGQFWDFSKNGQLQIIDRDLDKFIDEYIQDLEDIIQEKDVQRFIEENRKEIVKNIRKFMFSIYG